MKENSLGIYIHIPFCMSKCPYCDFYSVLLRDRSIKDKFIDSLIKEINGFSTDKEIDTIYFGGGTPNLLDNSDFDRILEAIFNKFSNRIAKNVEITTEFNPKSEVFDVNSSIINRFSLGIQSFNPKILKTLGRIHTYSDSIRTYETLRKARINNISFDIMFGIPNETFDEFIEDIKEAIRLNPEHISLYSLEFMEGTIFTKKLEKGLLRETDPYLDRKMYHEAIKLLKDYGYIQYEISNFSKVGLESKHNMKYWNLHEYIGFGPSAHSYIDKKRFKNVSDIYKYIENPFNKEIYEELSLKDEISEFTFTSLRKNTGIDLSYFKKRFNVDFFEYYKDVYDELLSFKDYINISENFFKLNEYGFDISNDILCLFV